MNIRCVYYGKHRISFAVMGLQIHLSHGYIPNMIIGDGDSLSVENRMLYKDRLLYVADQETNDLTKAIRFLLGKNFRNVVILGATGKEKTIRWGISAYSWSIFLFFILGYGDRLWSIYTGMRQPYIRFSSRQQVSIFNFGACDMRSGRTGVSGQGFFPIMGRNTQ